MGAIACTFGKPGAFTCFSMNINLASARARWIGAALLSLSFGINGCGGGGGGPSTPPQPNPTPIPTSTNNQCSNSMYSPNYVPSVQLLHWPVFPLRIYFKRDANYTAARQSLAIQGFNRWVTATNAATGNKGVSYALVNNLADSNVNVSFYPFTGGAGDTLGTTVDHYYEDSSTIDSADISLGITGSDYNDLLTAAHEMGHCLGILKHSPNKTDLMYFEGNDTTGGAITALDLNTILTAYCGNFNKNATGRTAANRGELKSITIH